MVPRMPELATALATLALATLLEIVARNWDSVTGGYVGIAGVPPVEGFSVAWRFNILVWTFVVLAVFVYENLMNSAHGRALNIVRHDRTRAMADGTAVRTAAVGDARPRQGRWPARGAGCTRTTSPT